MPSPRPGRSMRPTSSVTSARGCPSGIGFARDGSVAALVVHGASLPLRGRVGRTGSAGSGEVPESDGATALGRRVRREGRRSWAGTSARLLLRGEVATVLLCGLLFGGCAVPRSTSPVLKIGLIAPFEGLGRPLGYEVLYGVKLAIAEWNDAGGVGGYGIALVALNDDDYPANSARQALKMDVDGDVLGVIGPMSRATARAVAEPFAEAGLAWLVPASAPDEVISAYSNAFRLYADDATLAEKAIGEAISLDQSGEGNRIAVGSEGDFAQPLRSAAERLGVYRPLSVSSARPTFPLALGGNAEEVAEVLLSLGGTGDLVVAGPEAGRAVVAQRAGDAAEGLAWVGSLPPADADVLSQEFVRGYGALAGGPPGPQGILAYDATNLLLAAIERSIAIDRRPTRQGVVKALPSVHVQGLSGDLQLDEQGHWPEAAVYRYTVLRADIFAQPRLLGATG